MPAARAGAERGLEQADQGGERRENRADLGAAPRSEVS